MNIERLPINAGITIKAWDHEHHDVVVTTASYRGTCDHPDWGQAVMISYDNPNCHLEDLFCEGQKETETAISLAQFNKCFLSELEVLV